MRAQMREDLRKKKQMFKKAAGPQDPVVEIVGVTPELQEMANAAPTKKQVLQDQDTIDQLLGEPEQPTA